ncbi:uncharacterized protein LOC129951406 [Eupeodes corollae]|uniref:uncharacterized protein LOC129951406 n=1 Tax=Eupeodes corollae TaxID=290404 RepID=UPI002492B9BD|nr:uncharacterized protein LOC129951406 [Eupeodes corollae]
MDYEVCNLLQSWGLGSYTNLFRANSITYTTMMSLGTAEIRELFPIMGHRVIFQRNLDNLRNIRQPNVLVYETPNIYVGGFQEPSNTYFVSNGYVEDDSDAVLFF